MAPRSEGSQLKRARVSGSPVDTGTESFKKPRRSERLSQRIENDVIKTPISNKGHLPSPVTHLVSESTDEFSKEATATPDGRPSQAALAFSSPPQDTQAFSQTHVDPNAPLSDEVEDEVKEGVWGYLLPMDTRYGGTCVVLKKRGSCPLPDTVAEAVSTGTKKAEQERPKGSPERAGYVRQEAEDGWWSYLRRLPHRTAS